MFVTYWRFSLSKLTWFGGGEWRFCFLCRVLPASSVFRTLQQCPLWSQNREPSSVWPADCKTASSLTSFQCHVWTIPLWPCVFLACPLSMFVFLLDLVFLFLKLKLEYFCLSFSKADFKKVLKGRINFRISVLNCRFNSLWCWLYFAVSIFSKSVLN